VSKCGVDTKRLLNLQSADTNTASEVTTYGGKKVYVTIGIIIIIIGSSNTDSQCIPPRDCCNCHKPGSFPAGMHGHRVPNLIYVAGTQLVSK